MVMISVVTINRNNSSGLRRTLFSVVSQTYADYEYIVVDGDSTDDSKIILQQFLSSINVLIIEPDSGIYDAMNKGLKASSGEYVIFLNSGDTFTSPYVLSELSSATEEFDVVFGNIEIQLKSGMKTIHTSETIYFANSYQHDLPPHPSLLVRRSLYLSKGMFDTAYPITADVLTISRIFADPSVTYSKIATIVATFDHSGTSSLVKNELSIYSERRRFISKYFPAYLSDLDSHIRLSPARRLYLQGYGLFCFWEKIFRNAFNLNRFKVFSHFSLPFIL